MNWKNPCNMKKSRGNKFNFESETKGKGNFSRNKLTSLLWISYFFIHKMYNLFLFHYSVESLKFFEMAVFFKALMNAKKTNILEEKCPKFSSGKEYEWDQKCSQFHIRRKYRDVMRNLNMYASKKFYPLE